MTAANDLFYDPNIAGNSGTGAIGTPYGDVQWGHDQASHGGNGTKHNIKAGTAELLVASITWNTGYGTSTFSSAAPFIYQGYTSAAGDGGIGEININGAYGCFSHTTADYVYIYDMHIHGNTSGHCIQLDNNCVLVNCEINDSSGDGVRFDIASIVSGCYIHDIGASGVQLANGSSICYSRIEEGTKKFTNRAVYLTAYGCVAHHNHIVVSGSIDAIQYDLFSTVLNNSIYGGGSGTGTGITPRNTSAVGIIRNNLVEGFNGTGGIGIERNTGGEVYGDGNACYNNATHYVNTATGRLFYGDSDNEALSASPFTTAGTDPTPVDVDNVIDGNLPAKVGLQ